MKDLFLLLKEVIYRGSNSIDQLEIELEMPLSFKEKKGWISTSSLSSDFDNFNEFDNKDELRKALIVARHALNIFTDWNFKSIEYDESLPKSLSHLADDEELSISTLSRHCKSLIS
jgi:hypothetical protein